MLWTSIGCLIGAVVIFLIMYIWQGKALKNPELRDKFMRWRGPLQILYLALFIAAAVLFLIW